MTGDLKKRIAIFLKSSICVCRAVIAWGHLKKEAINSSPRHFSILAIKVKYCDKTLSPYHPPFKYSNWSLRLKPPPSHLFFPLLFNTGPVRVAVSTPRARLAPAKGSQPQNTFQVPRPTLFLTDRTQSPCLSESAGEQSFLRHHIPGAAARYVGGLDGLPCRKGWPRKQQLFCQARFFWSPTDAEEQAKTKEDSTEDE